MKLDISMILLILQKVICSAEVMTWLKAEAKKSETPIDDTAIDLVEMLLCTKA